MEITPLANPEAIGVHGSKNCAIFMYQYPLSDAGPYMAHDSDQQHAKRCGSELFNSSNNQLGFGWCGSDQFAI
jgi:hypothetical protein